MKKLFLAIGVVGLLGLASCNKCYTCDYGSTSSVEYCSKNYTSNQMDLLESTCTAGGGTWNSN